MVAVGRASFAVAVAALLSAALLLPAPPAQAATAPVAVFPIPNTRYNLLGSQIAFRGIPASAIGPIAVTGSKTGPHSGRIEADSDGDGGSFLPDKPFAPGERVTVATQLDVVGVTGGTYSFQIAQPAVPIPYNRLPLVPAGSNGVEHFLSRPDLQPAALTVTKNTTPASNGDIFLAPQFGPAQDGPMILDPSGQLIWFDPFPVGANTLITDFREQQLFGQPVLTWWQGNTNAGTGRGEGVILNSAYQRIAVVHAAEGLDMDLHEFLLTPNGDAYFAVDSPVHVPGVSKTTIDSVIQEVDIRTGLVLFEWHALDHVGLNESDFSPRSSANPFDPFHLNSISLDHDGNLIVSMRNTSAVYKIDHTTGQIIWRLGGKRSSFKMGKGTTTWEQHNAIVQPDGTLTLFDDGAGPPVVHQFSRGIRERLDTRKMTATLVQEYDHSPKLSADFEGSVQLLPNGDVFLGWGQQPYFSEDTATGAQVFDAHFNVPTSSYRAYRFQWSSQPPTQPALAAAPNGDGSVGAYASWNGATDVASWRVLAGTGSAASQLVTVSGAARNGFETRIDAYSAAPDFAVQAIGFSGQVLSTSPVVASPPRIGAYGHSAFVSPTGFVGLPVGCFTGHPCHLVTTVSVGRAIIARTNVESIGANGNGLVYFRLSPAGRNRLAHGNRLSAQVSIRDSSGVAAGTSVDLIPFSTRGRTPPSHATRSGPFQVVGPIDFVNSHGVGGILAGCRSTALCDVATTVSVGRTAIARTGREFLGAGEFGYLFFTLTSAGRTMLARAPGNQLSAQVTLAGGGATASAQLALARYG